MWSFSCMDLDRNLDNQIFQPVFRCQTTLAGAISPASCLVSCSPGSEAPFFRIYLLSSQAVPSPEIHTHSLS